MESTGTYYDLFFPIILHVMQATKSTGLGICVSNIFQILERGRRKAWNEDRSKLRIYFLSSMYIVENSK